MLRPYILRFQFVKIPQFVILLGIRYTTEINKKEPVYLVKLATCKPRAAELTSHPHLGGDDNATIFRTADEGTDITAQTEKASHRDWLNRYEAFCFARLSSSCGML